LIVWFIAALKICCANGDFKAKSGESVKKAIFNGEIIGFS